MKEKVVEKICYPYAYGRLDSTLGVVDKTLKIACNMKGVEISDEVLELLREICANVREQAVVESYPYAD